LPEASSATSHLRTALIETQDLSRQRAWTLPNDQFSNRASSLTPSSVSFLESIGTWQHIDQSRTQPYSEMQVWDAANDSSLQFDWRAEAQRYNAPPRTVATMVENANLTRALVERLYEMDAEQSLLTNTKVSSIEMGEDNPDGLDLSNWPVLTLDSSNSNNPSKIAARLLVGADGLNSPVRTFVGIASHGWDYNLHGVVATLQLRPVEEAGTYYDEDVTNHAIAFQRFLPQLRGPIAILPLPDNHASLVWSTTPSNAAFLKSLPYEALVSVLNAALHLDQTDIKYLLSLSPKEDTRSYQFEVDWRMKNTAPSRLSKPPPVVTGVQEGSVASFPLRFRHATAISGPRVALVGDAAHTVHPLAGQGLNLGLADAKSLANTIIYAAEHGMDLGDPMALQQYSTERFGKGVLMAGGIDMLNWMYQLGGSGEGVLSSLFGRARGLGMAAVNAQIAEQLGVKGAIMKAAEAS
jgi:ubiquinone biosynthesis monooxygenase Coq6